jgi:hypothetical protein
MTLYCKSTKAVVELLRRLNKETCPFLSPIITLKRQLKNYQLLTAHRHAELEIPQWG